MPKHYIYKIECLINGRVYIGQTKNKTKRLQEHKRTLEKNEHHSISLQRAWNKYGKKNFSFEIIEECDSSNVDERERYWIKFYNSNNPNYGFNMESGGNKHKSHNIISKLKLRNYALKVHRWQGKNNPNYGGHLWNDERREKYSKMNEEMWTEEMRKRQSKIMKQVYNLDNALDAVRVKVVKLTLQGEYIDTYNSITEAAQSVGQENNTAHICDCCKGNRRSAYGFIWIYYDDYVKGNYKINPSQLALNKDMKVVKLTLDNQYLGTYIYGDIKENKNKILRCIKGEIKSTKGYKWMKYEDYIKQAKEA